MAAVYNNLGLSASAKQDWQAAYDDYEKALEVDRRFAPAHNNLRLALKGEGKWDEAIRHFQEAVRLDAELAPAHYNLAEIWAFQGRLDDAVTHYRQALRIDPNSPARSTCSESRWPAGAASTRRTTAISGPARTTPKGPGPM